MCWLFNLITVCAHAMHYNVHVPLLNNIYSHYSTALGNYENGVRPSYSDRLTIQDELTVQYTENNGSLVVTNKFFSH